MYHSFGISSKLANGETSNKVEFLITDLFPNYTSSKEEELKSSTGASLAIDTTNLETRFILDHLEDGKEDSISVSDDM